MDIVKGDYGSIITFNIVDNYGSGLDLEDSTVTLKVAPDNTTHATIVATCTIDTHIEGTCYYTIQTTDFTAPGIFNYELEVKYAAKLLTIEATDNINVHDTII